MDNTIDIHVPIKLKFLQKTEKLLLAEGIPPQKLLKILGSLEDPKTAERIIKETVNKFGRIDILVSLK